VKVSDVTFRGFKGTSGDDRTIDMSCASSGCFNIVLEDINIVSSEPGKPASCSCNNAHGITASTTPICDCLLKWIMFPTYIWIKSINNRFLFDKCYLGLSNLGFFSIFFYFVLFFFQDQQN